MTEQRKKSLKALPPGRKVIWAVDAFHAHPKAQLQTGKALSFVFGNTSPLIQPVAVLSLGRFDPIHLRFHEKWKDLAQAAEQNLEKMFQKFSLPGLQTPRLIPQEHTSLRGAVEALLDFALEEKAEWIAVSSHSRKGLERFFIGSFAETLLLRSPLPVLVLHPGMTLRKRMKHILFPTDFSDASALAYARIVELAKELGCEITLLHKLDLLLAEYSPLMFPPVSQVEVDAFRNAELEKGREWVKKAQDGGVKAKLQIAKGTQPLLNEILRFAKKMDGAGIIAMASQSGPVEGVLLGSLTRQVVRRAPCPVLTLHAHEASLVQVSRASSQKPKTSSR